MRISVSDLCTVLLCLVSFPSTGLCSPVSWSTRRCCLLATMCTVCASRRSPGWSVCNLQVHCHEERLFTANREDNYRQKKPSWRSKLIYSTSVLWKYFSQTSKHLLWYITTSQENIALFTHLHLCDSASYYNYTYSYSSCPVRIQYLVIWGPNKLQFAVLFSGLLK